MAKKKVFSAFFIFFGCCCLVFAETARVTIFQTADIHSRFERGSARGSGGFFRLATLLRAEVEKAGGPEKCLTIDCGDTTQGSSLALISRGMAAVDVMNSLGYNVWVPGNHEFEYGLARLAELASVFKGDVLAANLAPGGIPAAKPWRMFEVSGCRIAVIGMTMPELQSIFWSGAPEIVPSLSVDESLGRTLPGVMRARPDIIILAVHSGLHTKGGKLADAARKYPQLSLVLGGHAHQETPGGMIGPATWHAESGKHADNLLKAEVEIDLKARRVVQITSELLPVGGDLEADAASVAAVSKWAAEREAMSGRIVGELKTLLEPLEEGRHNCSMNEFVCAAVARASGASAAFHSSPSRRLYLSCVTELEMLDFIPYNNTVCTLDLTGDQMAEIINEQLRLYDHERFLSLWGVRAVMRKRGGVALDGVSDDPEKRTRTAFSSHSLTGMGGRLPVLTRIASDPACNPRDTGILVRDAVRSHIKDHSPVDFSPVEWMRLAKPSKAAIVNGL